LAASINGQGDDGLSSNLRRVAVAGLRTVVRGETAFYTACKRGHLDVVHFLLDYGPRFVEELTARSAYDVFRYVWGSGFVDAEAFGLPFTPCASQGRLADLENALIVAAARNWRGILARLLKGAEDVDAATRRGRTALWVAAKTPNDGSLAAIRQLAAAGANVDPADHEGRTALAVACQARNVAVVKFLLEHGANPSTNALPSRSPVASAIAGGSTDALRVLLAQPAAALIPRERNCSPAYVAVLHGRLDALEYLRSSYDPEDVGLDASNDFGHTPLWLAAQRGHLDLVRYLVAHGADANKANKYGLSPLGVAAFARRHQVVVALLEAGADVDHSTALRSVTDQALTPLRAAAEPGVGFSALYFAAQNGALSVVRELLVRGADVHRKSECGTALDAAKRRNDRDIATLLVAHGALDDDAATSSLLREDKSTAAPPDTSAVGCAESFAAAAMMSDSSDADNGACCCII